MTALKLRRESDGSSLTLGIVRHKGGEGTIYSDHEDETLAVKIYHQPSSERANKLRAMLTSPPTDPARTPDHVSFTWPIDSVLDERGTCRGFLMPYVAPSHSAPLFKVYNPKSRRNLAQGITWEFLLRTASNLASVVGAVHERGYVIGDLNESNVLVSNVALVTLVDCDSMQVPHLSGTMFRCTVGRAEYTPAELHGIDLAQVERHTHHDAFGLAVLVFQLLMEGVHPFQGRWSGPGDPPALEERIRAGDWPYAYAQYSRPGPHVLSLDTLPPPIQELMMDCFVAGHRLPDKRPSAEVWHEVLHRATQSLATCVANPQHRYSNHLDRCPWCQRAANGLRESFPELPRPLGVPPILRQVEHREIPSGRPARITPGRARVLAIHGSKAQTGVSTTAVNLAAYLADAGRKTLLVDMSPEADATRYLGFDSDTSGSSVYELIVSGTMHVHAAVRAGIRPNLSLIPSSSSPYAAETELVYLADREYRLKRAIDKLVSEYDYILIDCKAWLGGYFTVLAFTAVDGVILPLPCEYFALEGVQEVIKTIKLVKDRRLNPRIELFGVVLTMFDPRTKLANEVVQEIKDHFAREKFETIIPRNVRLAEASTYGLTILQHDARSFGALAYKSLAEEVIARAEAEVASAP